MAERIVTIDGPAASGKSTVARLVAQRLDACFLDTGATYRAATLAVVQAGVDLEDEQAVAAVVSQAAIKLDGTRVFVDGLDVSDQIRIPELTAKVRHLAGSGVVRSVLVDLQRSFAVHHAQVVTEGRDQGTVVFPEAQVKVFLNASVQERARRRQRELEAQGMACDVDQIEADIIARDESDRIRTVGPLKPAPDAIEIDTTDLTIEQVVDKIVALNKERLGQ